MCVSNHIGMLDPFMIASHYPVAFAAKAEVRSWPVLGWVARTNGVFFVERGRRSTTRSFVEAVDERVGPALDQLELRSGRALAEAFVEVTGGEQR